MTLSLIAPVTAWAEVTANDAWARASILLSRPGVAYLTLLSDEADRLLRVRSPAASQVMIHAAETDTSGVSRMTHLESLELEPGVPVSLAPGGTHLMLMGLTEKLEEGARFPLTLSFERAGDVTIEVPVLGPGASGPEEE